MRSISAPTSTPAGKMRLPTRSSASGAARSANARAACPTRSGLVPYWAKDLTMGQKLINARAETLAEKPAFRSALQRRRCIIFADGFYEWTGTKGKKQPHRFTLDDGAPFAFAGLWERWGP